MSFSMKLQRKVGTTSQMIEIFIENSASAGNGKSGLAYNTASLTAYYKRNTAATPVAISLANPTLGTFTSGGFKEVDGTNMIGAYELHIPNAALIAGADNVMIVLQGASGMFPVVIQIELTAIDNQDAVRGGMTALPNTACTGNASLITSGSSTDQLTVAAGVASADVVAASTGTGLTDAQTQTLINQIAVTV